MYTQKTFRMRENQLPTLNSNQWKGAHKNWRKALWPERKICIKLLIELSDILKDVIRHVLPVASWSGIQLELTRLRAEIDIDVVFFLLENSRTTRMVDKIKRSGNAAGQVKKSQ